MADINDIKIEVDQKEETPEEMNKEECIIKTDSDDCPDIGSERDSPAKNLNINEDIRSGT